MTTMAQERDSGEIIQRSSVDDLDDVGIDSPLNRHPTEQKSRLEIE